MTQTLQSQIATLHADGQGKGYRQIARELGISPHAARKEIEAIKARGDGGSIMRAGPSTELPPYEIAKRAIAEAKTFDDVRDWEDKAAAVREYSRRVNDRDMELDAFEIRERSRRRRGELLLSLKQQGRITDGKPSSVNDGSRLTLESIDVTPNESARDQKIAALDGNSFERLVERCRTYAKEHPEKHSFDVLRAPDLPINGARSVMAGRKEPDDSLDFFPTPPWATRALIECALLQIDGIVLNLKRQTVWEPACGEGHMAEPLSEYFHRLIMTDVHDYGVGQGGVDFLASALAHDADWIITNPPFGNKTEAFVLRALDLAKVGVAMFVRLQWLETIGRYEAIFKDRPPTLIAFFAERVNLCKGRWEPNGGTATAYIWLVWVKGHAPQAPFWIPPGQREALTHPEDIARFAPQCLPAAQEATE